MTFQVFPESFCDPRSRLLASEMPQLPPRELGQPCFQVAINDWIRLTPEATGREERRKGGYIGPAKIRGASGGVTGLAPSEINSVLAGSSRVHSALAPTDPSRQN